MSKASKSKFKTNGRANGQHAAEPEPVTPLCAQCSALCCRQIALPLDNPEDAEDFDNIRWYLMHENVHVFVEDEQWYIAFATKCKHLQDDNRCGVYETRPRICRKYTTDNCEWHGGEYDYDHLFTSAEQLRRHAEEVLGKPLPKKEKPRKPKRGVGKNGKPTVVLPVS